MLIQVQQCEFVFRTWGGKRAGAGRKPAGARTGVSHLRRAGLSRNHPVHITLKVVGGLENLRKGRLRRAIFRAFARGKDRFGFRLVEFSVQRNHLHLIGEAEDERSLWRGVQGLSVRIARALNKKLGRRGRVFADRYHARALRTPREVRHALRFVLANTNRHGANVPPGWLDPASSAPLFAGWRHHAPIGADVLHELRPPEGLTVLPARTWLLRAGWRAGGLLDPNVRWSENSADPRPD